MSWVLRWKFVWQVARKELLSTVRDRRTLTSTILMPLLLIPLFTVGMPLLLGKAFDSQGQDRQKVGVIGTLPPALRASLTADRKGDTGLELLPVTDALQAVQSDTVDAVLRVPADLPTRAGQPSGTVQLYAKLGSLKAESGVLAKAQERLTAYNDSLVATELKARGLPINVLTPIKVQRLDASKPQESASGQLAFIIPMFLLQFILAGSMATAIDSTAGEKERGTLEVLLVTPVRRPEVVVGKLLATTVTALTSAAFGVVGLLLSGPVGRAMSQSSPGTVASSMGGQLSLTPGSAAILLLMALSAAALISALLISVSIFARSYKEAQTYITPITLLIVLPAVGLQFADFIGRSAALYSIPVVNAMVVILDIVKGSANVQMALLAVIVNLVFTGILVLLAVRSFGREQVIFRN